jgi:hypothetical protein
VRLHEFAVFGGQIVVVAVEGGENVQFFGGNKE